MAISKKDRELVFNKYGGKCAYCGEELKKGWHVDHLKAIKRKFKYDKVAKQHKLTGACKHPKNEHMDNYMPACASCNINKHDMPLEHFRALIAGFLTSLNRDSTQYRIAKRYGFIQEVEKPVLFYFEEYKPTEQLCEAEEELTIQKE